MVAIRAILIPCPSRTHIWPFRTFNPCTFHIVQVVNETGVMVGSRCGTSCLHACALCFKLSEQTQHTKGTMLVLDIFSASSRKCLSSRRINKSDHRLDRIAAMSAKQFRRFWLRELE